MIELLLSLLLSLTGLAHQVDPGLTAIAERRAAETATDATFSHAGMDPCCAEVLAWNLNAADPAATAAAQWMGSPAHRAILTDPVLTRIGCGHAVGPDGRDSFACVLDWGPAEQLSPAAPAAAVPGPAPIALPDTAAAP